MTVKDFINKSDDTFPEEYLVIPAVCRNGLKLSIQASQHHYCSPRVDRNYMENFNPKFYESLEIGFPNRKVEKLMPYAEDAEHPTDTVYGYVPIEVVEKVVEEAGGISWIRSVVNVYWQNQKFAIEDLFRRLVKFVRRLVK